MQDALRRSEEQLRQSQKMEAVGRLAGGVAHDFNNLLTAITGYSELLLQYHGGRRPACASNVQEIRKAGERAAALTRQLLTFSRKRAAVPARLRPQPRGVRHAPDAGPPHRRGHRAGHHPAMPDLHQVRADPGQMEQVILNLAVNARDAMPRGGRLAIETANDRAGRERGPASISRPCPGAYVRLTVTDTGVGMDEEVKAHLFEPFFTTKAVGARDRAGPFHGLRHRAAGGGQPGGGERDGQGHLHLGLAAGRRRGPDEQEPPGPEPSRPRRRAPGGRDHPAGRGRGRGAPPGGRGTRIPGLPGGGGRLRPRGPGPGRARWRAPSTCCSPTW